MSSSGKIAFVSSIFRDLVAVSPKFPKPGETIMGGDFFMGFGGKGANQCVMAAKLGAEAIIVGKVGDDEHGKAYTENLQQVKLTVAFLLFSLHIFKGWCKHRILGSGIWYLYWDCHHLCGVIHWREHDRDSPWSQL